MRLCCTNGYRVSRRRGLLCVCMHLADDVRYSISSFNSTTTLRVDPQSHMDVRETLFIWVVLRIFCQCLEKGKRVREMKTGAQYGTGRWKPANIRRACYQDRMLSNGESCPHLVYLILIEWYGSICYSLSNFHQVFLDVLYNDITTLV